MTDNKMAKVVKTNLLGWDPMTIKDVEVRKKTLAGLEHLEIAIDVGDEYIRIIATDKETGNYDGTVWEMRNPSREISDVLLYDTISEYMTAGYNFHMCAAAFYEPNGYHISVVNPYGTPLLHLEFEVDNP